MGCGLTHHTRTTACCSSKVGHEPTSTSPDANIRYQQQTPTTASEDRNASVTGLVKKDCDRSSQLTRQAFLDGTLSLDPRCPLDARQLYTLTKSWKAINRKLSVTAINIFVR